MTEESSKQIKLATVEAGSWLICDKVPKGDRVAPCERCIREGAIATVNSMVAMSQSLPHGLDGLRPTIVAGMVLRLTSHEAMKPCLYQCLGVDVLDWVVPGSRSPWVDRLVR